MAQLAPPAEMLSGFMGDTKRWRTMPWMVLMFGFLVIPLGAISPWLLAGATVGSRWNGVAVGVLLFLLRLPRGPVRERYGSWNRFVH